MNLPDVNVWLGLTVEGHSRRDAAQAWMDGIDEPGAARFCRATQQGLLRLLTTAAVMKPYRTPPLTNSWSLNEPLGRRSDWRSVATAASVF